VCETERGRERNELSSVFVSVRDVNMRVVVSKIAIELDVKEGCNLVERG
jgi:hypothetical protein